MIQYYIIIFSLSFMFYILYLILLSLLLSISHIYILSVPKYVIFHTSLKSFKFVQFFARYTHSHKIIFVLLFSIILSFPSTVFLGESF
jgi:hypothetical protein